MSRSTFGDLLKRSSRKIAQYTGYVHLGIYISIWIAMTLLVYLISGGKDFGTFAIYLALGLGSLINLCLGILFWFLPGLLIRYKRWRGKDWSGLLTVLNIGIIRYVFFPCWSLIFLCLLFSTVFKLIAWSDIPSSKSKSNFSLRLDYYKPTVSLPLKPQIKTPEKQAEEKALFEERKLAAEQGDASAQYGIGTLYNNGKGVPQNYEETVKWYKLAAEQGYALAQANLGRAYWGGNGVQQDYEEALKWYRLAAEQGDKDAQATLGLIYEFGEVVSQDYEEAFKWYKLAAEQGDSLAQFGLGSFYDEGQEVTQDYKEAFKWYRLSAEQGCPLAQYNLGIQYRKGDGVEKNPQEALKWIHLAAEQGVKIAQKNLGYTYWRGEGVPQDLKESLKWYKLVADQGDKEAEKMLKKLKQKASCEQIAEAMRSADEWRETHGR